MRKAISLAPLLLVIALAGCKSDLSQDVHGAAPVAAPPSSQSSSSNEQSSSSPETDEHSFQQDPAQASDGPGSDQASGGSGQGSSPQGSDTTSQTAAGGVQLVPSGNGQLSVPQDSTNDQQTSAGRPLARAPQLTQSCITTQTTGLSLQVKDAAFGAVGDGRTDDTAAIQRAINQASDAGGGTVNIPGGTYMINPIAVDSVHGLMMRNNVTLKLADDAVLKALPTNTTHYSLISFVKVENANLVGGTLIGERYQHTGQGGEWGHGVNIQSSQKVTVQDVTSKDFWGDGFYIGQAWQVWDARSNQVALCNVTSVNNRRQGLSIVDGTNIRVLNSTFSRTNGIAPQAGLDIEPENGNLVENVEVRDSVFSENLGDGIVLTWGEQNDASIKGVRLESNQVLDNESGIMLHRAIGCQVINNTIRNAGNQLNMAFPMTLHLFSGATDNQVTGNVHIGGKTVDAGVHNHVDDAATKAGTYVRGTTKVGQTVHAEVLDPNGVPENVNYQWLADGVAIPGATSRSYQLTDADANKTITVTTTFTDLGGNGENTSSVGIIAQHP